jgi:hypothetical protein
MEKAEKELIQLRTSIAAVRFPQAGAYFHTKGFRIRTYAQEPETQHPAIAVAPYRAKTSMLLAGMVMRAEAGKPCMPPSDATTPPLLPATFVFTQLS